MTGIDDLMVTCGGVRYRKEDATALGLKADAEVVGELAAIQAAADAAAAEAAASEPETEEREPETEGGEPAAGTLTTEKARPARNKARAPQNKG